MINTNDSIKFSAIWLFECYGPDGRLKWVEEGKNLVVNEGLNAILNTMFGSVVKDSTWFIGLKNTGTPAAGDTLASHASWTENENFTGNRKAFTINGDSTAQSLTNSSSPASFTFTTDGNTVAGGFLASVDTGTAGVLFNCKDFSGGNKLADTDDVLNVTLTISASSS